MTHLVQDRLTHAVTFRRLLSRGDLPDSAGGLYNPGAWTYRGGDYAVVRHEADYTWTAPCTPCWVSFEPDWAIRSTYPLDVVGFDAGTRVEDFRPFIFEDQNLVAHVAYRPRTGEPVFQRLSEITQNQLRRWDDWRLPIPITSIEKNWVLLDHRGTLHMVYSLDPLILCGRFASGKWVVAKHEATGLTKAFGKPLRNSTHLVPFDGGYLGFWHYILDRSYVTGAYWLDEKLSLRTRTPILLDGSWVQEDVYKPGVLYVSSAVLRGEDLLLFYGEGDAHTGVATLKTDDLRRVLG